MVKEDEEKDDRTEVEPSLRWDDGVNAEMIGSQPERRWDDSNTGMTEIERAPGPAATGFFV